MKTEFVGNIAFVVETGHIFVISGQTLTGAQRYKITETKRTFHNGRITKKKRRLDLDLKSGKHDDAPIPLRLSVRFLEKAIIRNTYRGNNEWLNEERDEHLDENANPNPLVAGDIMEMTFIKQFNGW